MGTVAGRMRIPHPPAPRCLFTPWNPETEHVILLGKRDFAKYGSWDGGITLDYLDRPNLITWVLESLSEGSSSRVQLLIHPNWRPVLSSIGEGCVLRPSMQLWEGRTWNCEGGRGHPPHQPDRPNQPWWSVGWQMLQPYHPHIPHESFKAENLREKAGGGGKKSKSQRLCLTIRSWDTMSRQPARTWGSQSYSWQGTKLCQIQIEKELGLPIGPTGRTTDLNLPWSSWSAHILGFWPSTL